MSSTEQFSNIPVIILNTDLIFLIAVINLFNCIMFKEAKVKSMYSSCNGAYLISYIWTFSV